ncbi:MAG: THUMP domain-containing protein, partial [Promethearchaeota archaeon]
MIHLVNQVNLVILKKATRSIDILKEKARALTLNGFYNSLLIRYSGEIGLKSRKVKRRLLNELALHLKKQIIRMGIEGADVIKTYSRLLIDFNEPDDAPVLHDILRKIPGIVSFSFCKRFSLDLDALKKEIIDLGGLILEPGDEIAVRVKRIGHHQFSSQELARDLGSFIIDEFTDLSLGVNLTQPSKTFNVEVRDGDVIIFHEIFSGMGGLPADTHSRVVVVVDEFRM